MLWMMLTLFMAPSVQASEHGDAVARAAHSWLSEGGHLDRADCSGFVEAVLATAGVPETGQVRTFWEVADREGRTHAHRPSPGDLVFFDRTYDSNRNGRVDDTLTHIAIVLDVARDGTVHMVHHSSSRGISELWMNPERPDVHEEDGRSINSWLARPSYSRVRLAGQLFHGYATVDRPEPAALAKFNFRRSTGQARPSYTLDLREEPVIAPPRPRSDLVIGRPPAPAQRPRDIDLPRNLERTVLRGQQLHPRPVHGLECEALWALRNTVFARHGYAFRTPDAHRWFGGRPWYQEDPSVNQHTVRAWLTRSDLANVALIRENERSRGCR